jgi:hypothetical protein
MMTRLTRLWTTLFVLALLSPLAARAASIEAESIELDTRFSFQHNNIEIESEFEDEDFGVTIFDLRAGLGYFFTSNWELVGYMLINHFGFDDDGLTDFGLLANIYYNFNTDGSIIPFVGAGLGFVIHGGDYSEDEDDTTMILPELAAGLRIPFREVVSLNVTAGYRHLESPSIFLGGLDDATGNEFFLSFGFTFFLQGGATE